MTTEAVENIDEILFALRANIEYLKTQGNSQINLKNGALLSITADVFIYEFKLEFLQSIDPDTEVEVRIDGQSANGKVIAVTNEYVQLQLDTNFGESVASAKLIISSFFLLEKLRERLESVKVGEIAISPIAEKAFHLMPSNVRTDEQYIVPVSEKGLNPSQEAALRLALGSDVSFIWGPPGTGKSQTIASIVEGFMKKGMTTLLIAHTNAATDSVMAMVAKHMKSTEDYADGKFVRVGKAGKELSKYNVIPEVILEEKARPLKEEIAELTKRIDEASRRVSDHRQASFMAASHGNHEKEIQRLDQYIAAQRESFEKNKALISEHDQQAENVQNEIDAHQEKGKLARIFSGTSLPELTHKKTNILSQIGSLQRQNEELKTQGKDAKARMDRLVAELDKLRREHGYAAILTPEQVKRVEGDIKNLKKQKDALVEELDGLGDELIGTAKVVATTLTMSYTSKKVLSRGYDCVILDEASMAPLPAVLCAAGLAKAHAVIVGDFYQLPPIAKHETNPEGKTQEQVDREERLVNKWLKRDIFELVGITSAITKGGAPDDWLRQLKVQYRMHPDISGLINRLVYKKYALENGPQTLQYGSELLHVEPLRDSHVGIYDTGDLGSVPQKTENGSHYNLPHALLLVALAKQAIHNGYKSVGIISAYRAQINLVQKIVKEELDEDDIKKVLADTVHRFQGGEKEVILFDVTTPTVPSMYDDGDDEGDDMKLMNVALSRAQQKCIIVADVAKVKSKHTPSSLVKRAIEHCEVHGFPIEAGSGLLEQYSSDDRTDVWLGRLADVGVEDVLGEEAITNERDFYKHFIPDLLRAEKEVIIVSAFITSNRMNQLRPILERLIQKGVRVFVITRPPEELGDNMKLNTQAELPLMEKMGVTVLPVTGKTHEKIASIDRQILWEGSLNILSQRESSEIMFRTARPGVAAQILTYLKLDKNIGELGSNQLRRCEVCTKPGSWYWTGKSRYGQWTYCLTGMHAPGKPPKERQDRKVRDAAKRSRRTKITVGSDGVPICPEHNLKMTIRMGRFGKFYGCPNYPKCDQAISATKIGALG